jgi:ParB-like chromosome segregation protein Spo0J
MDPQHTDNWSREVIALETVDLEDRSFVITFAADMRPLRDSIARVGIIYPPLVQQIAGTSRLRVVSGLQRIMIAREMGETRLAVRITGSTDGLGLFLFGLDENLGTRRLNVVEKSLALEKLVNQFGLNKEEICRRYLPLLGLGTAPEALELYLSIARFEHEIKEMLAADRLSLATVEEFAALTPTDRLAFIRLVDILSLGKNLQREFLRLLTDLSRMEHASIEAILMDSEAAAVLRDSGLQAPLRAKKVRELLLRRRYPRFCQAVEQLAELRKNFRLPPHISLSAPPYFEGQSWRLAVTFRNREELEQARRILAELAGSPLVDRLMNFTLLEKEEIL